MEYVFDGGLALISVTPALGTFSMVGAVTWIIAVGLLEGELFGVVALVNVKPSFGPTGLIEGELLEVVALTTIRPAGRRIDVMSMGAIALFFFARETAFGLLILVVGGFSGITVFEIKSVAGHFDLISSSTFSSI